MIILPKPLEFEWDKGNKEKNVIEHKVSNKEAEDIFVCKTKFLLEDIKHSKQERRFMLWGKTKKGRFLTAIFTLRGNKIRIISVRDMHKKERREYVKKEKTQTNTSL